jgi:hypothetical protein
MHWLNNGWEHDMTDRIKNLGKYAHKSKSVPVGKTEDDMSAKRMNPKMMPNKMPSKMHKGGGGVRG